MLFRSISAHLRIHVEVLWNELPLNEVCAAVKMRWASGRMTTRPEDRAYSLMGIFGINMPIIYGEGTNAFRRLQEEILSKTEDYSLFAWPRIHSDYFMADTPDCFQYCVDMERTHDYAKAFSALNYSMHRISFGDVPKVGGLSLN